jgi:hypothetical protein
VQNEWVKTIAILCCAAELLCAAEGEPRWRTLNRAVRQAQEAKDYGELRRVLMELRPLLPGNPRIAYNLAACETRLENPGAALAVLRGIARLGLVYDLAADSDFASLRGTGEWTDILRRMEANRRPVARARTAFALGEADLIPEDIAYDAKTARFFVSSVRKAKILTGDGREFARTESEANGKKALERAKREVEPLLVALDEAIEDPEDEVRSAAAAALALTTG